MGTKNNPGLYDCYEKADPDEPIFVLRANDKYAPTLVWLWASLAGLDGTKAAKVQEAQACATDMMRWAHDRGRPVVGIGQATLAGCMELIRAVNSAAHRLGADGTNQMTDIEALRMFMAETTFDPKV